MWVLRRPAAQHYYPLLRAGRATCRRQVRIPQRNPSVARQEETSSGLNTLGRCRRRLWLLLRPRVAVTGQQRKRVPLMASAGAEHDR
jgi:hypothetical protein